MNATPGEDVVVGVVGRPWGLRGQFLLNPQGSRPDLILAGGRLRLRRKGVGVSEHSVIGSHFAGGRLVVAIVGSATPSEAESFRGAEVLVAASEFSEAPEGSFYPHELTGLEVVRVGGELIGRVEAVLKTSGVDLLVVRAGDRELLVPFAEAICRVDRRAGRVEIDPPEGLLDLAG